jgi:hypothetical protein
MFTINNCNKNPDPRKKRQYRKIPILRSEKPVSVFTIQYRIGNTTVYCGLVAKYDLSLSKVCFVKKTSIPENTDFEIGKTGFGIDNSIPNWKHYCVLWTCCKI